MNESQKPKYGLYCNRACSSFKRSLFFPDYCTNLKTYVKKGEECLREDPTPQELEDSQLVRNMNEDHEIYTSIKKTVKEPEKSKARDNTIFNELLKNRPPFG